MTRKEQIKSAYKLTGGHASFYDGMMTYATLPGKAICRVVWNMDGEKNLRYLEKALSGIPEDFSRKLLEVPVGTGVLTMPVYRELPDANITCLDYSENMMAAAREKAGAIGIKNITFLQGDVGALPFEDESFDIVLSLNGFHAFPDKEAAYRETYRVLKPGGTFCGCFYVQGGHKRTDWFIRHLYQPKGFFTPPYETAESLRTRLSGLYREAEVTMVEGIGCFCCKKKSKCEKYTSQKGGSQMKADYRNWVPKSMVYGLTGGTLAAFVLFLLFGATGMILQGTPRLICGIIFGVGTLVLLFFTVWMGALHRTFDYNGKRKLAKTIIDGTAKYVTIPDGGTGLDVGCGSGALTIACAKRNPKATMVGCDIWSGAYKADFTKKRCEENAKAEGVSNVRFEEGNAIRLPFEDESFDAVTSNYVYHNIAGHDKQKLLLETLRVLKKGGTFAIHDLMSKARYGDMDDFVRKLKAEGYEEVRLIDTTDGTFMGKKEASWLGLAGSTLLIGKK